MEKQKKYRIVCDIEGRFTVQEAVARDDYRQEWMTVYNCENKNEAVIFFLPCSSLFSYP